MFNRVADLAQRGIVVGLFSVFAFQAYQIGSKVFEGRIDHPTMKSTYFEDVNEKVKEEYVKAERTDQREWYAAEDNSYLKNQVRANITKPEAKSN